MRGRKHEFGFGKAKEQPLTYCPDCKKKLPPPLYGPLFTPVPHNELARHSINAIVRKEIIVRPPVWAEPAWHSSCDCGVRVVWSYDNEWKRRHAQGPLFDQGVTNAT